LSHEYDSFLLACNYYYKRDNINKNQVFFVFEQLSGYLATFGSQLFTGGILP